MTKGLLMIGAPDGDNKVDAPAAVSAAALPEMGTILANGPRTA